MSVQYLDYTGLQHYTSDLKKYLNEYYINVDYPVIDNIIYNPTPDGYQELPSDFYNQAKSNIKGIAIVVNPPEGYLTLDNNYTFCYISNDGLLINFVGEYNPDPNHDLSKYVNITDNGEKHSPIKNKIYNIINVGIVVIDTTGKLINLSSNWTIKNIRQSNIENILLQPYTKYIIDNLSSTTFDFNSNYTNLNSYEIMLTTGENPPTISFPKDIKWVTRPIFNPNKRYLLTFDEIPQYTNDRQTYIITGMFVEMDK
jgi:hypothetical protein